jgi:hypothetical protein
VVLVAAGSHPDHQRLWISRPWRAGGESAINTGESSAPVAATESCSLKRRARRGVVESEATRAR